MSLEPGLKIAAFYLFQKVINIIGPPEMQIEVSSNLADEDDYEFEKETTKTTIRCVIGPKQSIWTMFCFLAMPYLE